MPVSPSEQLMAEGKVLFDSSPRPFPFPLKIDMVQLSTSNSEDLDYLSYIFSIIISLVLPGLQL